MDPLLDDIPRILRIALLSIVWIFSSLGGSPPFPNGTWPPATSWLCPQEAALPAPITQGPDIEFGSAHGDISLL
jgi:hypothetical protein